MPTAATARPRTSCARSSRLISISRRPAIAERLRRGPAMREFAFAVAIMATGGFTGAAAQNTQSGDDLDRYQRYQQTPAVSARYGDVPIKLDAPALARAAASFTDQQELEAFLAAAARRGKS